MIKFKNQNSKADKNRKMKFCKKNMTQINDLRQYFININTIEIFKYLTQPNNKKFEKKSV